VAVVKGQESYDLIKSSCSHIFDYINKVIKDGLIISVDGKDIPVEFILGGDYKVTLSLKPQYPSLYMCAVGQCISCISIGYDLKRKKNRKTQRKLQ